jgi:hypothetical protein
MITMKTFRLAQHLSWYSAMLILPLPAPSG